MLHVEGKSNGLCEIGQQLYKSLNQFLVLPKNPGPMDLWWVVDVVVDEWKTQRTYWEVNSSALTCEELHYTSITSLTHSLFPTGAASQYWAVTISLLPTGLEFWFNHNPVQKHITPSLAYSKSCKHFGCTIDCNLIPFQSILFLLWSLQRHCCKEWRIRWKAHVHDLF